MTRILLFGLLLIVPACGRVDRPTAPSPIPAVTIQSPIAQLPAGSVQYLFNGPVSYEVRDYTAMSSYVLNHGTFSLRYGLSGREYVGTYRQEGSRISFVFAADGRWDAVGKLDGDSLEVRYNLIMELSDFENAVYRRVQ